MAKVRNFDKVKAAKIAGVVLFLIVIGLGVYLIFGRDKKDSSSGGTPPPPSPLFICTGNPANCIPANTNGRGYNRDGTNLPVKVTRDTVEPLQQLIDKYPDVELYFSDNFGSTPLQAGSDIKGLGKVANTPAPNEFYKELMKIFANSQELKSANQDLDKRLHLFEEKIEGVTTGEFFFYFEPLINVQNIDTRLFRIPEFEEFPTRVILTSAAFENGCPPTDYCATAVQS